MIDIYVFIVCPSPVEYSLHEDRDFLFIIVSMEPGIMEVFKY